MKKNRIKKRGFASFVPQKGNQTVGSGNSVTMYVDAPYRVKEPVAPAPPPLPVPPPSSGGDDKVVPNNPPVSPFQPYTPVVSTVPSVPTPAPVAPVVPPKKPGLNFVVQPGNYNQSTAVAEDVYAPTRLPSNDYATMMVSIAEVERKKRIVLIIVCVLIVAFIFLKK